MEQNITYTDKIVNQIQNEEISELEWVTFVSSKYKDKGFTLIGVRREKRIVRERISDNAVNKFDIIAAAVLSLLSGVVSFLLGDRLLDGGSIMKVFFPIIIICVLSILFSYILINMRDKNILYNICNEKLMDIEKKLEEEYTKAEVRKMIDEDYLEGSIINTENINNELELEEDINEQNEIELESFKFDFAEGHKDTKFGIA